MPNVQETNGEERREGRIKSHLKKLKTSLVNLLKGPSTSQGSNARRNRRFLVRAPPALSGQVALPTAGATAQESTYSLPQIDLPMHVPKNSIREVGPKILCNFAFDRSKAKKAHLIVSSNGRKIKEETFKASIEDFVLTSSFNSKDEIEIYLRAGPIEEITSLIGATFQCQYLMVNLLKYFSI